MVALVFIDHILLQERIQQIDDLGVLRQQINTLDTQLLLLLAQRKRLVEKIGRLKAQSQLPVQDSGREQFVHQQWQQFGKQLGLDATFIQQLADIILAYSRKTQERMQ